MLAPSLDNTLFESATGDRSSGVDPRGFTGATNGGAIRRYLVQFDVAGSIPPGSTIQNVFLNYTVVQMAPGGTSFGQDLHRMNTAWGEGLSNAGMSGGGAPSTPGDAT